MTRGRAVRATGSRRPALLRAVGARIGGAVLVLWAVATVTFLAVRLIPGDPAQAILGGPGSQAPPEAVAAVRAEYGLDQPLLVQYLAQLGRLAQGDLGRSYALREDVVAVLARQLPGTLLLAVLALAVAWILALGLALVSTGAGRVAGAVGAGVEIVAASLPHFWIGVVLILVFSTGLGWLPAVSGSSPAGLVLPVLTLAIPLAGFLGQIMREALLDALDSPFALAARARGESEAGVRLRHALRHAAAPGIALSGWAFGFLISGAVVVEQIFARPGLGRTALAAVTSRDVPVIVGVVLVVAVIYIVLTAVTDLLARIVDPRLVDARTGPVPTAAPAPAGTAPVIDPAAAADAPAPAR
ncbi:ABC transporter permease [Clavibacter nebraskensis]|uniref:Peptide ABC transporter, permease component n=3 Tax=Clavibacter nebraskensis TaxID=31963 RepID=A0AAI8ZHH4_9MICO|nr:ABC transporter permease [Clavibacter nebraskensis]KXU20644.1 ABC transporter permease [Clavibacter nebraskensis]OAH22138.1 ABC transporter permease [Clavibacter nebraskensis]QGV66627.1 ABC transporter permease [Clavibacter nebraskensis]QGV69426.1 ABC transporter permease [Clavibacter nebraskensis]QGV72216.1 ABC transporter permease [Clavibacter nebraskensis]